MGDHACGGNRVLLYCCHEQIAFKSDLRGGGSDGGGARRLRSDHERLDGCQPPSRVQGRHRHADARGERLEHPLRLHGRRTRHGHVRGAEVADLGAVDRVRRPPRQRTRHLPPHDRLGGADVPQGRAPRAERVAPVRLRHPHGLGTSLGRPRRRRDPLPGPLVRDQHRPLRERFARTDGDRRRAGEEHRIRGILTRGTRPERAVRRLARRTLHDHGFHAGRPVLGRTARVLPRRLRRQRRTRARGRHAGGRLRARGADDDLQRDPGLGTPGRVSPHGRGARRGGRRGVSPRRPHGEAARLQLVRQVA